jgi:hypothetical protein
MQPASGEVAGGSNWEYEVKFDGYRPLEERGHVRLMSRTIGAVLPKGQTAITNHQGAVVEMVYLEDGVISALCQQRE